MKRIRYIRKILKQDETDQKPWSMLVTNKAKRNEAEKPILF